MTTLVVSNWHQDPELLLDQLHSYNAGFDGDLLHYVNINADFEASFWEDAARKSVDFSAIGNLRFLKPALATAWGRITHAYFRAVLAAMEAGHRFDYVYFHTSSDLLIKPGAHRHLRKHDLGLGRTWEAEATFIAQDGQEVVEAASTEGFEAAIRADPRLAPMLRGMGMRHLHKSRTEGCFFRADLFFEIMYPLLCFRSTVELEGMTQLYPVEEYLFAGCVEFFCAKHRVRRARHLVLTSQAAEEMATAAEFEAALADPQVFGLKRFAPALDDPLRIQARRLLG